MHTCVFIVTLSTSAPHHPHDPRGKRPSCNATLFGGCSPVDTSHSGMHKCVFAVTMLTFAPHDPQFPRGKYSRSRKATRFAVVVVVVVVAVATDIVLSADTVLLYSPESSSDMLICFKCLSNNTGMIPAFGNCRTHNHLFQFH